MLNRHHRNSRIGTNECSRPSLIVFRKAPGTDSGTTPLGDPGETFDRVRFSAPTIDQQALAGRREAAFRILEGLETVEITRGVLARAAQPPPTPLGTLGAIHLVSALGWREQFETLAFATHDLALAAAARASGFEVIGTGQE